MKRIWGWILSVGICCIMILLMYYCYQKLFVNRHQKINSKSIFSWEAEFMEPENIWKVSQAMKELDCQVIYQEVPKDTTLQIVTSFLQMMRDEGKDVYYLTGASEWGLSDGKEIMLKETEIVSDWNKKINDAGFTGIVWDVEPYLLDEWDADSKAVMKSYVDNCVTAYDLAQDSKLKVIVCIPNFYDAVGYEEELERLIASGCDAIAVMNYNKKDEAGQIENEVFLAEQYKKGIINITEIQKPGYHKLTEENTYYHDGISGVEESWRKLKVHFDYEGLGFSWHYLKPALSLLEGVGQ